MTVSTMGCHQVNQDRDLFIGFFSQKKKKKTINKNEKKTVEKQKNTNKFFAFVKQHLQLLFKR